MSVLVSRYFQNLINICVYFYNNYLNEINNYTNKTRVDL